MQDIEAIVNESRRLHYTMGAPNESIRDFSAAATWKTRVGAQLRCAMIARIVRRR